MENVGPPIFLDDPGEPPEPWHSWIAHFDQYLNQLPRSEDEKRTLLRLYLGREGSRVLDSLLFTKGVKQTTYAEMVTLLDQHYGTHSEIANLTNVKPTANNKAWKIAAIAGGAAIGGVGAVALAPVALAAAGFTSAGIAASSLAASMMSSAAIANGGGVAAGGLVAVLQSAGAAGLSTWAAASLGTVGAGVGGAVSWFASKFGKNT